MNLSGVSIYNAYAEGLNLRGAEFDGAYFDEGNFAYANFGGATFRNTKFNKTIFAMIAAIHVLALFAPFTFSWTGLILFLVFYYITGGWGITLCYHRLLTHGSFKCWRPVRYFLTACGCEVSLEESDAKGVASTTRTL